MIYKIFANALQANPDANAIVTSKGIQLTYQQVDVRVKQWANYFLQLGVKPDDAIGVLTQDEDHHVFIFLALDLIAATYVPFDKDTPSYQLQQAITIVNLAKIVMDEDLIADYGVDEKQIIPLNSKILSTIEQIESKPLPNNRTKVSVILTSSGSTGLKKWIPIQGDGFQYWAEVERKLLQLNETDRILCTRSPAFDARISEYVRAFAAQGCLYLLDAFSRKDLDTILNACQKHRISCLILIASQLNNKDTDTFLKTLKESGLKHLMVTGDACSPRLVHLCERFDINLWNCYGPTEATFGMSILRVNGLMQQGPEGQEVVPIAKPIPPVTAHISSTGELQIQSPFLSPGYLGMDKNSNAFSSINVNNEQARVFNTGDKFYQLPEELLGFAGRANDESHAKVSGVKISPFAIERCINDYSAAIIQCVVVIKSWQGRHKPFAYMVLKQAIDPIEFSNYLKSRLREEEFPIIIELSELPRLLPSQKVDKQALIRRQDDSEEFFFKKEITAHESSFFTEKTLEYQQLLSAIWCELFKVKAVDLHQEFLLLGGDSIMAMELSTHIKKRISASFSYKDLMQLSVISIYEIANFLVGQKKNREEAPFARPLIPIDSNKSNIFFLPPLLGEGYFTYKELAQHLAGELNANLYGLSDPGIHDASNLPKSLEHAAQRYIAAIRAIQPEGPYQLLGFSFGCTLAYKTAQLLQQNQHKVSRLHLMDGFSPFLCQQLNAQAHASLLKSLMQFIIQTLGNDYFRQKIGNIDFTAVAKLPKKKQIITVFGQVIAQLHHQENTYEEAKCLLLIAQQHLLFVLEEPLPSQKLAVFYWPNLYLTNQRDYHGLIDSIKNLSASDRSYFCWNRYFYNLRRNRIILDIPHINLLKSTQITNENTAFYLEQSHNLIFNFPHDNFYLNYYYIWIDKNTLCLLFINHQSLNKYKIKLDKLNIKFKVSCMDKNSTKEFLRQDDFVYTSLLIITCIVPTDKLELVQQWLNANPYKEYVHSTNQSLIQPVLTPGVNKVVINLDVYWHLTKLFTISLSAYVSNQELTQNDKKTIEYKFISEESDHKAVLREAEGWLCEVMLMLKPCLKKAKGTTLAKGFFMEPQRKMEMMIKKYNLNDSSQACLEKGLRIAATNNQVEDLRQFINFVHNINAKDSNPSSGKTALHWAAIKGHTACYNLLLEHKAKPDCLDAAGKTPADYLSASNKLSK